MRRLIRIAAGFVACIMSVGGWNGCNHAAKPWENVECMSTDEVPRLSWKNTHSVCESVQDNKDASGGWFIVDDDISLWRQTTGKPGMAHRIRVLRQTNHDDYGNYVQQRFDVELIDENAPSGVHLYLFWMGPRALVDLSGGVFVYTWNWKYIPRYMSLESEAAAADTLRNEAGELLLADGRLAFEEQLTSLLPEFEWAPVDLGCTYEEYGRGTTAEELRRVMATSLKVNGQELTLHAGDVGQWEINCRHLFVSSFAMKTRPLVAGGEAPIPSRILFSAWREGMLEKLDGGLRNNSNP